MNLYGYVLNNPVNFIDPLGLFTTITLTSGAVTTVSTAKGVENAVKSAPDGSIADINAAGHASQFEQGLGDVEPDFENIKIDKTTLRPMLYGFSIEKPIDLGELLKGKMAPNGKITMDGCEAGKEKKVEGIPTGLNIAKAVSNVVPNIPVSGSTLPTFGNPSGSSNNVPIPFTTNTYKNGVKQ